VLSVRLTALFICLTAAPVAGAADGGVQLYLQPFGPEAAKLTFTLASVSAVSVSGSEVPLNLRLKSIGPAETGRQRLLAGSRLPIGRYAGFIFRVSAATLKSDRGQTALALPDSPVRLDVPFSVSAGRTPVVWLVLRYQESVIEGFRFSPVFSAVMPPRPVVDHSGFVTNASSNSITVFDKTLGQAVAVIDTCAGPAGLALDQQRRRLYVACSRDDEIQSIDVAAGEVVQRTQTAPGDHPRELALTPDGTALLVASPGSNSVSFFDAASLTRQDRVTVGSGPNSVLVEPSGRRAFVFNTLSTSVSVLDIASRSVAATVSMDAPPLRGQFSSNGSRLYVIHERSPFMTVIDPRQLNIVTRARLSTAASALAIDPVRGLVCVDSGNAIEFYDPNALMPLFTMRARPGISHLMVDPEDNRLYMVDPDTRSVVVGSLADRRIVSEIDVGDGPYWVAVMGEK
jgi:YVTN family beta-propeller protein